MSRNRLISVIVPIYNASQFLNEALESLCGQSHTEFEGILVDDGSTDNSAAICRKFCEADPRFRLITQENRGLSGARNTGLENARGEWISFLDADDALLPDSLEVLLTQALENDVKIVSGEAYRGRDYAGALTAAGVPGGRSPAIKAEKVSSEEAIVRGLYQKVILNSMWGKIFHRAVFNGPQPLRFYPGMYEDLDLFYQAFERVPEIVILHRIVYFYRDNPESFINTWSDSRLDVLDVTDRIAAHMKHRSAELYKSALDRRFSAHFNILLEMEKYNVNLPEQRARCLRVIKEQRRSELSDPEVRMKNKLGALISYLGAPAIRLLCRL